MHDERDRFARDLHDTVIQGLFAAGLNLQGIAGVVHEANIAERLGGVVQDIDSSITQLRSIIYALGLMGEELGVRATTIALLRELSDVVGFEITSSFDGPVDTAVSGEIAAHLLIVVPFPIISFRSRG